MDDVNVDYSKLLENIFKQFNPSKFDKIICVKLRPYDTAYYIRGIDTSFSDDIEILGWEWEMHKMLFFRFEETLNDHLRENNISVDESYLEWLDVMKYPERYHKKNMIDTIKNFKFVIVEPCLLLPEPETEGGYESWMM